MATRHFYVLPITKLGIWSLLLIIAMPLLFFVGSSFTNTLYQSVPSGDTLLADVGARPALALTMLAGMIAGISAFITGLIAIIKKKDRALLTYVSCSIGALLILFLAGEFLSPH